MNKNDNILNWAEQYHLLSNHLDPHSGFSGYNPENSEAGCLFETYDAELKYIQDVMDDKIPGLSAANVWTLIDCDQPEKDSPSGITLKAGGWEFRKYEGEWIKDDEPLDTHVIINGMHHVNRVGYLITRLPALANTDYQIYSDADLIPSLAADMPSPS